MDVVEVPDNESALVASFSDLVQVPSPYQRWYAQYEADRKYVNEKSMLLDTVNAVATNYILRNQIVLMANMFARDPAISWQPAPVIGEHPPLLKDFGKTLEIFCKKMAEETELRRLLRGAIQDASTVGWAIFKLNPQEDPALDPLGVRRQNDQLDNIARYQWLLKRQQAGLIDPDSAAAKELEDLKALVVRYLQDQLEADLINNPVAQMPVIDPATGMPVLDPVTGEPMLQPDQGDPRLLRHEMLKQGQIPPDMDVGEIPRYVGFNLDPVQPEDFRFDWTVSCFENLYQAQWMAHRVYMDYDTFGATFQVDPEEIGNIVLYDSAGHRLREARWSTSLSSGGRFDNELPTDRKDLESQTNMGRAAVWELWHRGNGRVYIWAEGMRRFLRNAPPLIVGRRWYPFYFLAFNRVCGRVIPLSDTVLTRQLQDELNRRRTLEAEAQEAAFPRVFVRRGSLTPEEKVTIETSHPYQVIEVDAADDIRKAFAESQPLAFNPQLYSRIETRMELEMMSGISRNAAGTTEGDLATTAAIANEQMGVQVGYRQALLEELIYDIMYDFAYMGIQFFPEDNIKRICGMNAYWPLLEREQFLRYLKLQVRAGSMGRPDIEKNMKAYEILAQIAPTLGLPIDGEALLEDIMYDIGKNDWRRYLMTPEKMLIKMAQGMPLPMPMQKGAPPVGPPGPRGNAAKSEPTPGEGRPTMAETGPPSPEQVPGPV